MKDVITRGSIVGAVVAVVIVGAGAVGYTVGDRRTTQPAVVEQVMPAAPSVDELPEPVFPDRYTQVEYPAEDTLTPHRPAARGQLRAELERLRDDLAAIRDLQRQVDGLGSEYR